LIPDGDRLGSVLAGWSPYRFSSRIGWRVIRLANHLGAMRALPNVAAVRLGDAGPINWRALGWKRDTPPLPLIYIGTPGPRRKAVIHLIDCASRNCEAIVKLPLGPEAKDAIIREADTLAALAEEGYPFSPRLLYVDRKGGIATQQFLPGTSASRGLRTEYCELLHSLMLLDQPTTISDHVANFRKQLISSAMGGQDIRLLESALDEAEDEYSLPACHVHGDFTPWNIRRRERGSPVLIDWEDFQARGLPLQDAYHFLHMQDFLFHRRPSSHFRQVMPFAASLGITEKQGRKLEIAYLIHSYANCCLRSDQQPRGEYLLKTMALVMRDREASASATAPTTARLRLMSSRSTTRARAVLFDAVIKQLNDADVPYCLLGGYENGAATVGSDLDIMVRPQDLGKVPTLLSGAGRLAGALLVQAIQHETTACYFVLALQDGKHTACLDVDCYGDYRRDARTWLLADSIIAHRRQYGAFYVPAVADEFTYYLIKKVMKQSITLHQLKRLQQLFAHDPERCHESLATLWLPGTALLLERAIVDQGLSWLEVLLPKLLIELVRSRHPETLLSRGFGKLLEFKRLLRRIAFPTGLSVVVAGGDGALRSELADGLIYELAPAFRRVKRLSQAVSPLSHILQMFEICVGRMRSTLFIRTSDHDLTRPSTGRPFERLRSRCSRPFAGVNLALNLRAENVATSANGAVFLNSDDSSEQVLQNATRTILQLLAQRTQRRPKFPATVDRTSSVPVENSELRSVGLD